MNREKLLKTFNEIMDDKFLYGREPHWRIRSLKGKVDLEGGAFPDYNEIAAYREKHLSCRASRKVEQLLAQRTHERIESDGDIIVNRWTFPQPNEVVIRSRCFEILYGADVGWHEEADLKWRQKIPDIMPNEGWLLIEEGTIVGATEFDQVQVSGFNTGKHSVWLWLWVFIDPEFRRQGITSKRLPLWKKRYGQFLVDQPSSSAIAMFKKTGYDKRLKFKGQQIPFDENRRVFPELTI